MYRQNNNIRRVDFKRIGSVLPVRSRCCFGHTQYIIQWTSCGLPWIDVCPRACVDDIITIDNPKVCVRGLEMSDGKVFRFFTNKRYIVQSGQSGYESTTIGMTHAVECWPSEKASFGARTAYIKLQGGCPSVRWLVGASEEGRETGCWDRFCVQTIIKREWRRMRECVCVWANVDTNTYIDIMHHHNHVLLTVCSLFYFYLTRSSECVANRQRRIDRRSYTLKQNDYIWIGRESERELL